MNTKTVLNIKTDKSLKESAQAVARDMGLPLGTIMNHYLRDFVAEKKVVFASYPVPNKKTGKLLKQASADYIKNKNIAGPFKTSSAAMAWLNSDAD